MTCRRTSWMVSFEGVNRSNAVVNFSDDDPFDAKAVWLNAEHIRRMKPDDLAAQLRPIVEGAGYTVEKALCDHAPDSRANPASA